jgi:hypothetical protein
MKKHLLASTLALLAISTVSSTASADWKGYAGAFCHGPNNNVDVRRSSTGIANWGTGSTTVYCPIVRDVAAGGNNRLQQVAISLFNNNSTSGGCCTLISRTQSRSGIVDSDQQCWSAGFAHRTVRLGPVDANNWGNYLVYCRLPARQGARKSIIYNVRADENP